MALLSRILVLVILLSACERDPARLVLEEETLGVFGVLQSGTRDVRVLVLRFPSEPAPGALEYVGVTGADVRIASGADTIRLTEVTAGGVCYGQGIPAATAGCYMGQFATPVSSNATYDLRIRTTAGDDVSGSVVVPAPPTIVRPSAGTTIVIPHDTRIGTVQITLEPDPVTGFIESYVAPRDAARICQLELIDPGVQRMAGVLTMRVEEADSLAARLRASCMSGITVVPVDTLSAVFNAVAYDTAFARYHRDVLETPGGNVRLTHAAAGLRGAIGYFAGSAKAAVSIFLQSQ